MVHVVIVIHLMNSTELWLKALPKRFVDHPGHALTYSNLRIVCSVVGRIQQRHNAPLWQRGTGLVYPVLAALVSP